MASELGDVLVVEDSPINRRLLVRRLERRGYDVTSVGDGEQALAAVDQGRFDLVLLDVVLPGISGLDVLKKNRKTHSRAQLPVIMSTSRDSSDDVVEALMLGANDYVTKPFDIRVVLARVGTHLILKKTTESLETANAELARANERLHNDLQAAADLQLGQLPQESPRFEGCEVAWAFRPCDELAGDFLNVVAVDDEHIALYILDVCGHGVRAALTAVAVHRTLLPSREDTCIVVRPQRGEETGHVPQITDPNQVLERLSRRFPVDSTPFFTIVYGVYHRPSRELRFAVAGHPRPRIVRAGCPPQVVEGPSAPPIGVLELQDLPSEGYQEERIQLNVGDRVCFFSDGVVEALSPDRNLFGESELQASLTRRAAAPLGDWVSGVLDDIDSWLAGTPQSDDISVLGLAAID